MSIIHTDEVRRVKAFDYKTVILVAVLAAITGYFCYVMSAAYFFKTIAYTAHYLITEVILYIMAVAVLAGALGAFLTEFGVVAMLNRLLAPIIKLFWGLPGAASVGAISTYLSDNPAILSLAKDKTFIRYFHVYQRPALTNFGTSFGMGIILTGAMMGLGEKFVVAALVGNAGAIIGSIISTRMMLSFSKKALADVKDIEVDETNQDIFKYREIREGTIVQRAMNSILDGGKTGVQLGVDIIPGVIIICSVVFLLTCGKPAGGYTGEKLQGVNLLGPLFEYIYIPIKWVFGLSSPEALSFPLTCLGSTGAAIGIAKDLKSSGSLTPNDVAVFTAIGMCWSGYLATHVAMMDSLGFRKLTGKAILSHTAGGIVAGIAAHQIFALI